MMDTQAASMKRSEGHTGQEGRKRIFEILFERRLRVKDGINHVVISYICCVFQTVYRAHGIPSLRSVLEACTHRIHNKCN